MNGKDIRINGSQSTQTNEGLGNTLEMNSNICNRNASDGNIDLGQDSWVNMENEQNEPKDLPLDNSPVRFCRLKPWKEISLATKVDRTSRVLFPFLYAVFNTMYWWMYLNQDHEADVLPS